MFKRQFSPATGVSNIELFYDLIFVYCISVITGGMHLPEGGFFDADTYAIYTVEMLTILQIWFFTTFLQNRYGDGSAFDNVCLFINMFLLFFMAGCIGSDWQGNMLVWNVAWAFVLLELMSHWTIKRVRYTNLDDDDKAVMNRTIIVLGTQAAIVFVAAFLPVELSQWISLAGFAFGWLAFAHGRRLKKESARFDHLAERCSLLVIVTFGETIVGIAGYMAGDFDIVFALLVFALVVGLFLVYFFEHDHMLDHHRHDNGIGYMLLTSWIVFAVGNITVGLEYLPEDEVSLLPKSVYLAVSLIAFLLTSFLTFRYNKSQYKVGLAFGVSRVVACAIIAVVTLTTNYDPLVTIACDTVVVWAELAHEYVLYHGRNVLVKRVDELGISVD